MQLSRRKFLGIAGGLGFGAVLGGLSCYQQDGPLSGVVTDAATLARRPLLGLTDYAGAENDYPARVDGDLPRRLCGTLYRNGPGLFARAGRRKRCFLDGDGMLQAFVFGDGAVRYRNRYVATGKFLAEKEAGRYLFPTWTTQAPGGFWRNLGGGDYPNQAGITVFLRDGTLYAFDEYKPPYALDPVTLETRGESWLGLEPGSTVLSAHAKIDPVNGDWVFFGIRYGRSAVLELTVLDRNGRLKNRQSVHLPRYTYMHDILVSERHILVNLPPVEIDLLALLSGYRSMVGSLRWLPGAGNLMLLFERDGSGGYRQFETEASWMWHGLNAFEEKDGGLVADLVGYRYPDHLLGHDPALFALMEGRRGTFENPGHLLRYRLDPAGGRSSRENLATGNLEFSFVNQARLTRRHRFGYFAELHDRAGFYNGLCRVDCETGAVERYRCPDGVFCGEPVFARDPAGSGPEPGWLLSQAYDTRSQRGELLVLDAARLAEGPVARVKLQAGAPLGFHGFWAEQA